MVTQCINLSNPAGHPSSGFLIVVVVVVVVVLLAIAVVSMLVAMVVQVWFATDKISHYMAFKVSSHEAGCAGDNIICQ